MQILKGKRINRVFLQFAENEKELMQILKGEEEKF
jgi:hypothetical protein